MGCALAKVIFDVNATLGRCYRYRGFESSLATLHERPEDWHITYADIDVL